MKTKTMVYFIFILSVTAVVFYPSLHQTLNAENFVSRVGDKKPTQATPKQFEENNNIDVVFVLDTTGSMGGLIQAAKEKIWSIASTLASNSTINGTSKQDVVNIRMGLVAFRDKGDNYVTRVVDLTDNLDAMYAKLMDFKASGGGDGPESVNLALYDAVTKMSWNKNNNTYKVIFLIGDAPPHMDYQDDIKYPQTIALANKKGIIINTIQAGRDFQTKKKWQQIAALSQGDYFQVSASGNAVAITSPFDRKITELSNRLDDTIIVYGDRNERIAMSKKVNESKNLTKRLSATSRTRRAVYNNTASGRKNTTTENDLVGAVREGKIKLDKLEAKFLPSALAMLSKEQQKKYIVNKIKARKSIRQELQTAVQQRAKFLKDEVAKLGEAKNSFDTKIYQSVKKQAEEKGIIYTEESLSY